MLGGSWTLSWHQPNREEEKGQNSMTHRLIDTFSLFFFIPPFFFCWLETIVRVKCVTERTALLHTPAPPSSLSASPHIGGAVSLFYFILNFTRKSLGYRTGCVSLVLMYQTCRLLFHHIQIWLARIGFPFSAYGVVSYTATRSSLFLP
jgi:hypothetical protein